MSNKKETEKKPGFFKRAKKFFKVSYSELKKVHWPTLQENLTYTGVVLVTVTIMAVLIWLAGSGITALFRLFV